MTIGAEPIVCALECSADIIKIRKRGVINKALETKLNHIPEELVSDIVFYYPVLGFKITFCRKVLSGTCFDTDVYGAQQQAPLMELLVEV